jgi:hypothetical protein
MDAQTPAPIATPTETPSGLKFDPIVDVKYVPMLPVPSGKIHHYGLGLRLKQSCSVV